MVQRLLNCTARHSEFVLYYYDLLSPLPQNDTHFLCWHDVTILHWAEREKTKESLALKLAGIVAL